MSGQVVIALAVGLLTYGGAYLLDAQGWLDIKYPLPLALLTGLLALIPAVGPPLTYVLVVLLGLLRSPLAALLVVLLVIAVHQLVNWLVVPRVARLYGKYSPGAADPCDRGRQPVRAVLAAGGRANYVGDRRCLSLRLWAIPRSAAAGWATARRAAAA